MPRGRRPSIAALTRFGARKTGVMVILTCRTLHFSRVQSSAIVVIRPETTSSSHRRPRAIALTRRGPALELFRTDVASRCIVRKQDLAGSFGGGFCQGIESDRCAWDEHRGFGFIKPDDGGADIFVHAKSIIGASVLQPRQQVEFESVFDSVRGKYRASDVRGDLTLPDCVPHGRMDWRACGGCYRIARGSGL